MTYEMAIRILDKKTCFDEMLKTETTADKLKTRADEALKMAIEALEKQIPKRALPTKDAVDMFEADKLLWGEGHCPNCEHYIRLPHKYCYKCGQAIDWEEK